MDELNYIQNGEHLIPDLKLSNPDLPPLNKYGRMRKEYLKQNHPGYYNRLVLTEELFPHCLEVQETFDRRLEQLLPQLAKEAGATEQLKASDPMKWVGLMNNCKAQAEEILIADLIHS